MRHWRCRSAGVCWTRWKVRAALGPTALDYVQRSASLFHVAACGAHDYSRRCEFIDTLLQGMEDARAVHILYQSERATEPAWRDVYPYGWAFHKHALYLVAQDPSERKTKHYKLDRIDGVELTNFPFPRPAGFTLAAHLAGSFGVYQGDGDHTVKVRFAPSAARYVSEAAWNGCQRLTRQRDGSLLAVFRLSALEEIKSWVLGFGRKALVLEPEELRREIADELRALAAAYAAPVPRDQPARRPGTTSPA
jgi:predicted DNA-binding transcriptional regulator YafY